MSTNGKTTDHTSNNDATLGEKDAYDGNFRGETPHRKDSDDANLKGESHPNAGQTPDRTRAPGIAPNKSAAHVATPLPAAMGYCARRILEALDDAGDAGAQAAFAGLTPATRELLTWWFGRDASRRRQRNFNCGQREAILHTVLAHELFGSDDPQWLFRAACSAWPGDERSAKPHASDRGLDKDAMSDRVMRQPAYAAYCLRMAPGAGGRWVLQALLIWQWAGHTAARARAISDDRFSDPRFSELRFDSRFALLVPDQATARRFETALLGPRGACNAFDTRRSSLIRHAEVFLPPHVRAAFAHWLDCNANDDAGGALRIGVLDDACVSNGLNDLQRTEKRTGPVRLVVGDGAMLLSQADAPHAAAVTNAAVTNADVTNADVVNTDVANARIATAHKHAGFGDLAQRRSARQRAQPMSAPHLLWIELDSGQQDPPPGAAVLADLNLARALRIGAVKSLLLAEIGAPVSKTARHRKKPAAQSPHRGLRPVLPRRERPVLDAGLRVLERFEHETRALRLHLEMHTAPALLVLCEDLALRRAVAAYARTRGFARETIAICDADNADTQLKARIAIDALPARHAAMQSRFCAVVLLRNSDGAATTASDLGELLWPALAPHWHDPALAQSKAENRERIGSGRTPCDLIDVLTAIAATWPTPIRASSREGQALLRIGIDALPPPCGDLLVTELRDDASAVDIVLPNPAKNAQSAPLRWLSQQPQRLLRARQSLPVRKSVYRHQGWSAHDNGLERGLIEMADADPHIAAFCLFDAQRQPWPEFNSKSDDDGIDGDSYGNSRLPCPNALVRTPGYVYVVRFAPYLPESALTARTLQERVSREHPQFVGARPNQPPLELAPSASPRTGRDAIAGWCRRVNALPADRRQFREWRPVQLQAPLFWSWKRRGGTLSSLLSALADTTPIAIPIAMPIVIPTTAPNGTLPTGRPPH